MELYVKKNGISNILYTIKKKKLCDKCKALLELKKLVVLKYLKKYLYSVHKVIIKKKQIQEIVKNFLMLPNF